ncbi:murein hydrolase activator EnvC family protein [Roseicyclus sp.]|jgi:murein hydrolase activator|uniref:murein hydrolase activator EnvC family protein n=1 Tax=Roseicyclus sp. TaxID=1914329 RepID=UPI004053D75F
MSLRAITLAFVLLASPVRAEFDAGQTAAQAAEMLEQAGFALLEAQGARDRVEALTQTVRAYEEGLLALREGIRQAALRERTILMAFDAERDRLSRLLGVLQSIEAAPAPVVLMHPEGPLGTARAGMILSEVTPAVASQARALRAQLEELAALRAVQDMALRDLSDALERAQDARTQLSQAIAERRMLPENFLSDDVAMTQLVDSVDSLDTLSALLAQSPPAASPELPDFITARGTLPLPVLGTQLRAFGEADAAGVARPGLVYATRAGALVTAPWPASVRYAGPLLDYGNVIILEPEAGYLLVLAGLDTVYVNTGVVIPAAGPLGLMPGGAESDTEELIVATLQGSGAALSETLYMELRENGVPVDPAEWFIGGGRN